MPSQLKQETARANGAKSHGPKTPEGRAKSSQNALKHGLSALKFVLPTENRDEFYELRDAYFARFQPADPVELRLVEAMVLADYRLRRLITIETNLLSNEMVKHGPNPDPLITDMDDEDRLAWSFNHLANNHHSLALLARYQGQLDRAYTRAFKQLRELQKERREAAAAETNVEQVPQVRQRLPRPDSSRPLSPAPLQIAARQNEPKPEPGLTSQTAPAYQIRTDVAYRSPAHEASLFRNEVLPTRPLVKPSSQVVQALCQQEFR